MADTIAAISTAPMRSAIGIIRVSGERALDVTARVFRNAERLMPRMLVTGAIADSNGEVCDFGMCVYFKAPASFTGEDMTELHCHGSTAVLRTVYDALLTAGARPAKAGEFTQRAFLNGKMDLTQAEAVIDLIDSETALAAKNAAEQIGGAIGREITAISNTLVAHAATFYAYVDYPDDEIEEEDRASLIASLTDVGGSAFRLAESYSRGRLIRDGVRVALIGRPNVGKSSILNRLVKSDRSIVTDTAGTTRDTVEESVSLGALTLRLIDTAGLRDGGDEPERLGVLRSEKAAKDAELVLAVFDNGAPLCEEDFRVLALAKSRRSICVINKCELTSRLDFDKFAGLDVIRVSALENTGFDELAERISSIFADADIPCDGKTVTNPRHASALRRAGDAIFAARDALARGLTPDVAVTELESAINTLGEITGKNAADSVVAEIFSRFCVGK